VCVGLWDETEELILFLGFLNFQFPFLSNCVCSFSWFAATEWVKGKQMEEVLTIKNA
jgi:hypothetical protein